MDVRKARALNFEAILSRFKTQVEFAEAVGLAPGHVSQLHNGTRRVGDEVARRIEQTQGLPEGWMDHPHEDESALDQAENTLAPTKGIKENAPPHYSDSVESLPSDVRASVKMLLDLPPTQKEDVFRYIQSKKQANDEVIEHHEEKKKGRRA